MNDFAAIKSTYVQAAYAKASQTNPAQTEAAQEGADFSSMVSNAAQKAVETVRMGDSMAIAGLQGQAGLQQVVEATMAMESTVQVTVALRDKLVEAYQDVMRMPI